MHVPGQRKLAKGKTSAATGQLKSSPSRKWTYVSGAELAAEAKFPCFVQLGQEVPIIWNIFNILQKIKDQVDV
jgi:hypothetical protein